MTASETVEILRKMIGCRFAPPCGEDDICSLCKFYTEEKDEKMALETAIELIRERKTGRWIDRGFEGAWNYCSECGEQSIDLYDYCPNCGAKMEELDG